MALARHLCVEQLLVGLQVGEVLRRDDVALVDNGLALKYDAAVGGEGLVFVVVVAAALGLAVYEVGAEQSVEVG